MIFNTELVLEAAKKVDENVGCYQKGNLIGIAFWMQPPGTHKISHRTTNDWIEITVKEKTCRIEVGGWDGAKPPAVWKLKNEQICNGRADEFLVGMLQKFDVSLIGSVNRMLDPLHRTGLERSVGGGQS